jgi:hypothetical protein
MDILYWRVHNGTATVYSPVDGEGFYFDVCLTIDPKVTVVGIYVEPYISVCFSASPIHLQSNKPLV